GNDATLIEDFKISMKRRFAMTDLGKMRYFLGVEVIQNSDGIFMHQHKYATEILVRFGMESCNKVNSPRVPGCKLIKDENERIADCSTYKQMVGCLMYLLASRPDIALFRILYNAGVSKDLNLIGWSDSDYAGDLDDKKSTTGFVFMLGSGAISWSSKKQPIVTLSTTEAEFVSAASCACQGIW
ncbi:copia-type polyprotein, partial [Trifolium pratense]